MVTEADCIGHVDEGKKGDDGDDDGEVGVRKRRTEGQTTMNFVKMTEKTVENMYFKKREEHRAMHTGGQHLYQKV